MFLGGHQEIQYGGGDQDMVVIPPVRVTAASLPTVHVEDTLEGDTSAIRFIVAENTAVVVDGTNTTTTAAAGRSTADHTAVALTDSTAFVVGRHYVIESTAGDEVFRVDDISGNNLRTATPLRAAHPSGAAVWAIEIRHAFPETEIGDVSYENIFEQDRPMRALWKFSVGERLLHVQSQLRFVKGDSLHAFIMPVVQGLKLTHGRLLQQLRGSGGPPRDFVQAAADELAARIRARGDDPSQLLTGDSGYQLLRHKTVELLAENGYHPPNLDAETFLDHANAHFARVWRDIMGGRSPQNVTDIDRASDQATATHSQKHRSPIRRA